MTNQGLQVRQSTALVSPYGQSGGDPWSPVVDFMLPDQLPMLKIAHPNSKGVPEGVPPGRLYNVATQEAMEAYRCVLLYAKPGQIAFPDTYSAENSHLCRSNDGVVPTGDGSDPQGGPCRACDDLGQLVEQCPWLQWQLEDGYDRPPKCSTTYHLLLWELEGESGAILTVMRKAASAFRALKSGLRGRKHTILSRYSDQDVSGIPYNLLVPIELRTVKETSPRGAYYIPKFTILGDTVDVVWARQLARSVGSLVGRVRSTDLAGDQSVSAVENGATDDLPF